MLLLLGGFKPVPLEEELLLPVPLWTVLGIGEGRVARERGKGLCLNCSPLGDKGVGASLLKSDEESIPHRLL